MKALKGINQLTDDVAAVKAALEDTQDLAETETLLYAKSKDELHAYLASLIEGEKRYGVTEAMLAVRKTFRELYFYNPDGKVSQRILGEAKRLAKEWDVDTVASTK